SRAVVLQNDLHRIPSIDFQHLAAHDSIVSLARRGVREGALGRFFESRRLGIRRGRIDARADDRADRVNVAHVVFLNLALDAVWPDAALLAIVAEDEIEAAGIAPLRRASSKSLLAPLVLEANPAVAKFIFCADVSERHL